MDGATPALSSRAVSQLRQPRAPFAPRHARPTDSSCSRTPHRPRAGDSIFLDKAKDLGNRLLPAFNTPSGIPRASVVVSGAGLRRSERIRESALPTRFLTWIRPHPSQLNTGAANNPGWTGGSSILAELGTLQVEFRYLGAATREPVFARKAEAVIERMDAVHPADGLFPIYVSADTGQPTTSHVTFGALGDSFYEYLLKVWLQGGRAEPMYRRLYDAAMVGMEAKLLKHSRPSGLAYVADWNGANVEHKVCVGAAARWVVRRSG